jgi:hypothetical protein
VQEVRYRVVPDDENHETEMLDPAGPEAEIARLRDQLTRVSAERDELRELAESYRLSAKERSETISELLRVSQSSPSAAQARELRRLRALERRFAVRLVVNSLEPLERPYQAFKRRTRKKA